MNLEKAIEVLNTLKDVAKQNIDYIEGCKLTDFLDIQYKIDKEDYEAIDTVLKELDTSYNKGYQDGFQSVRYDKYVNDRYGEGESAIKYLAIEREGYIRGYAEAWKRAKEIKEGNNEQV